MALVVSGPSGSGKSTICKTVLANTPKLEFSVSCTTRQPRSGETHGVDYHFITRDVFEKHIADNDFIEYAEVHGNYYGTLKSELTARMQNGIDVLLDIDVQGAMKIRENCRNDIFLARCCEFVFIAPPSEAELERRLRGRGTETEEVILRRLANAKKELTFWDRYSYIIINDDLNAATDSFVKMLDTLRLSCARFREVPFHVS